MWGLGPQGEGQSRAWGRRLPRRTWYLAPGRSLSSPATWLADDSRQTSKQALGPRWRPGRWTNMSTGNERDLRH